MEKTIVVASTNAGKIREFRQMLEPEGYKVISLAELPDPVEPEETGTTFQDNKFSLGYLCIYIAERPELASRNREASGYALYFNNIVCHKYSPYSSPSLSALVTFILKSITVSVTRHTVIIPVITATSLMVSISFVISRSGNICVVEAYAF